MKSYESCVKSCSEEYTYYDKKLRERRYKFDKNIIVLDDNAPFTKGEIVRIMSEKDFQLLFEALKKLKKDKNDLINQIDNLKIIQEDYSKNSKIIRGDFIKKFKKFFLRR
ncbi:hypothetical protein [Methanobacterium alcaliphilum]|uniref:hypothetical protein n=1 Tax=Methanobacterium alcaliphilum TaxID=392018 RepID=UPI002009F351|nr:hypothetical protein [Methanobacterium alcaliphilum]MCK9150603.1 hypothetical protein [Methanobacterium alcaliphilum]